MRSVSRVRLAVTLVGAIAAGSLLVAGPAVGKKHAPKKHGSKKHYTASGHGTYESTGQACFGAKWVGTGGWTTSYKETTVEPNVGTTTDTFDGDSSYSWDESQAASGADCALELLKFPGSKPTGGATWNAGHARIGSKGREVETFPSSPTVTTPCTKSVTQPASGGGFSAGGMVLESKGSSLVFEVNLGFPSRDCDYGFPGDAVPQGKVGDFLESTSVKVPKTVFEHAHKVVIAISSDPKHGAKPNCGVQPASIGDRTVKCSQSGVWQGTLTLYEG